MIWERGRLIERERERERERGREIVRVCTYWSAAIEIPDS